LESTTRTCLPVISVGAPRITCNTSGLPNCTSKTLTPSMDAIVPVSKPVPLIRRIAPAGRTPPPAVTFPTERVPPTENSAGLTVTEYGLLCASCQIEPLGSIVTDVVMPGAAFGRTGTDMVNTGRPGNNPIPLDADEKCASACCPRTLA